MLARRVAFGVRFGWWYRGKQRFGLVHHSCCEHARALFFACFCMQCSAFACFLFALRVVARKVQKNSRMKPSHNSSLNSYLGLMYIFGTAPSPIVVTHVSSD